MKSPENMGLSGSGRSPEPTGLGLLFPVNREFTRKTRDSGQSLGDLGDFGPISVSIYRQLRGISLMLNQQGMISGYQGMKSGEQGREMAEQGSAHFAKSTIVLRT